MRVAGSARPARSRTGALAHTARSRCLYSNDDLRRGHRLAALGSWPCWNHHGNASGPQAEPPSRGTARRRMGALAAGARTGGHATGHGSVRVRQGHDPCVLSDHCHRVAAVRAGRRWVGGNRCGRQRRPRRDIAVHGRRDNAQPLGRAKRGTRLSHARAIAQG